MNRTAKVGVPYSYHFGKNPAMSYAPPPNPFQSPQYTVGPNPSMANPIGPTKLEYLRAYNYIFENPNWIMNILWGFLCILSSGIIPVVGQLVFLGYQFEVIEALIVARGARYPDFDINRFSDYLTRGLWPFLVQLVVSIVLVPVFLVLYFGGFMLVVGGAAAGGEEAGGVVAMILIPFLVLFVMVMIIAMTFFMLPMFLRAGLAQDFGQAFNFSWIISFVKNTWVEMLLSTLFVMVTGSVFAMLGMLALCVGIYAAVALIMLAQAHFYFQLYSIFLSRGGEPIPLKPRMAPPTMPPMTMPPTPLPPKY